MRWGRRSYFGYGRGVNEESEGRGERLQGFLRLLLGVGVLVIVLALCPLAVLFLVALVSHPEQTSDQVTGLFSEIITIISWSVPVVVVLSLAYLTRHVWYAWLVRPMYARHNRFPAVVNMRGEVRMLDDQKPRFESLGVYSPHEELPMLPEPDTISDSDVQSASPLPRAKSIYDILPLLDQTDKIPFGYDLDGLIWLSVDELLSIVIAGNSGRGKSRALLYLTLMLLRKNVQVVILDGKGDLRRWLGSFHAVAYLPRDIMRSVDWLMSEADRRLDAASQDVNVTFPPIIVVMDELDLIAGRYERVAGLVERLTKKTRSVNMHGMYCNQSIPAELVGGVKTRGVITSRVCFYCDDEAARLVGVRANNGAANLLHQVAPPAEQGLAVASTVAFGWRVVAFPFVPDGAIAHVLPPPTLPPLPMKQNHVIVQPEATFSSLSVPDAQNSANGVQTEKRREEKTVSDAERQRILALAQEGHAPSDIARIMRRSSNYYYVVRQVLAQERRDDHESR